MENYSYTFHFFYRNHAFECLQNMHKFHYVFWRTTMSKCLCFRIFPKFQCLYLVIKFRYFLDIIHNIFSKLSLVIWVAFLKTLETKFFYHLIGHHNVWKAKHTSSYLGIVNKLVKIWIFFILPTITCEQLEIRQDIYIDLYST